MSWTDERVERLKKLWQDGLSASQIAAELGGVTRNAVIGKVHRLGLSNRGAEGEEALRFARRWAQEAEIRHEALDSALDAVRSQTAHTGTVWAEEALSTAGDLRRQATTAARAALQIVWVSRDSRPRSWGTSRSMATASSRGFAPTTAASSSSIGTSNG